MRLSPAPVRSRTRGARTGTGPRPVMIARSGRCPWRTRRWRPSPVCLSAWPLRKAATSASTACANSARAPSRRTSVSGSENSAGWISLTTLSWIMACHSFGGEVEVSNTPTIRRLIPHAVTNFRAYLKEGLHRGLAKAPAALMRPVLVVAPDPLIKVGLQLGDRAVDPLAEGHPVELVQHRLVETLNDAVRLWAFGLGAGVIHIL